MVYVIYLFAGSALTVGIVGLVVNLRTLQGMRRASGQSAHFGAKARQSMLATYGKLGGSALLVPVAILAWLVVVSSGTA